jgi:hypothetical protein
MTEHTHIHTTRFTENILYTIFGISTRQRWNNSQ